MRRPNSTPVVITGEVRACSRCGAPIVWRKHDRTGNPAPIDTMPQLGGNVDVIDDHTYRLIPRADVGPERMGYVNHFATCPNAGSFRR